MVESVRVIIINCRKASGDLRKCLEILLSSAIFGGRRQSSGVFLLNSEIFTAIYTRIKTSLVLHLLHWWYTWTTLLLGITTLATNNYFMQNTKKILLSVRKEWNVNTYRSQVTVTSLNASEDIVVNSSPDSSLNTTELKHSTSCAGNYKLYISFHYKEKLWKPTTLSCKMCSQQHQLLFIPYFF